VRFFYIHTPNQLKSNQLKTNPTQTRQPRKTKQTNQQNPGRFKNQGLKVMVLYSTSNSSPIFAYGLWLMAYGL